MRTKQYARRLALAVLAGSLAFTPVLAATTNDPATEAPAFTDPVQARRAAALAEQAAMQTSTALRSSLRQVDAAEQRMERALATGDQAGIMAARRAMERAQQRYAEQLSAMTGVMADDIERMHENGMDWGQIASELGVHPGEPGTGHDRGERVRNRNTARTRHQGIDPDELAEATARDMENGWSTGHGTGMAMGEHAPGTGLTTKMGNNMPGDHTDSMDSAMGMTGRDEGHGGGPSGSEGGGHGGSGGPGGGSGGGHGGSGSSGGGGMGDGGSSGGGGGMGDGGSGGGHGGGGGGGGGGRH